MARSSEDSAALKAGLAVGLAAAADGISYGALAVAAGLDVWQACVMSLLMVTGGSQFAIVLFALRLPFVVVVLAAAATAALIRMSGWG